MTLPIPFWIYGRVLSVDSIGQANATVNAKGDSHGSYASTTTQSDGRYQLNIQDNSSDGDTVEVIATIGIYSDSSTFTLTLGNLPEEVNLQFTETDVAKTRVYNIPNRAFKINYKPGQIITVEGND